MWRGVARRGEARRGEARRGSRVCTAPSRIKPDGQCDYKGKVRRTAAVYGAGTKLDFIPRSRHSRRDNEFIVVKLSSRVRSLLVPARFSEPFFVPRLFFSTLFPVFIPTLVFYPSPFRSRNVIFFRAFAVSVPSVKVVKRETRLLNKRTLNDRLRDSFAYP